MVVTINANAIPNFLFVPAVVFVALVAAWWAAVEIAKVLKIWRYLSKKPARAGGSPPTDQTPKFKHLGGFSSQMLNVGLNRHS